MTTNPNLVAGRDLQTSDIEIPADGAQLRAYLSRPSGGGSAPGVIVIHENRGLVPYTRDVADGLASSGYIALAVDLLSREGGTDNVPDVSSVLPEIPRERHVQDLQAAIRYLKDQPDVTRIGVIGMCFGGGIAWRLATSSPDVAAAAPFYGMIPPIEDVPKIRGAVYAVYGELDERINQGIPTITDAVKAAGTTFDMKVYAGAGHAFHNHTNAERHNAKAASEAWGDTLAWFDKYLKG